MTIWESFVTLDVLPEGPQTEYEGAFGTVAVPGESKEAAQIALEKAARRLGFAVKWSDLKEYHPPPADFDLKHGLDDKFWAKYGSLLQEDLEKATELARRATETGKAHFALNMMPRGASKEIENTPCLREALELAEAEAKRLAHAAVGPEHYLLGIIAKGDGLAIQILSWVKVDTARVRVELETGMQAGFDTSPDSLASRGEQVMQATRDIAKEMGCNWYGTEHLLVALTTVDSLAARILRRFGLSHDVAREKAKKVYDGPPEDLTDGHKEGI